ncbi:DUF6455 family protein [Marivita sp. S2033]|uniref:DUF6455 family protein n=1 Tax=Marivita sp. S2033 TaxID=3373187 RepID=UPI0039828266
MDVMNNELGDPELHFWLTRSVARTMGVNLSEAMACNQLSPQEYSTLVTACRACALVETCKHWLGGQTGIARTAPVGCINSEVLEALAQRH